MQLPFVALIMAFIRGLVFAHIVWGFSQGLGSEARNVRVLPATLAQARGEHVNAVMTSRAGKACASLKSAIMFDGNKKGVYISPQSDAFIPRSQGHWSDNCWQYPSCIVTPTSSSEVAHVMSIITSTQTKFSVRSGGHDFNVNHSSVGRAGVLIDLSNLNSISLSKDKSKVTVGAGSNWGSVHKALSGTGVSVNGARGPNPGVGGQTLGGGIGWLTQIAGVTASSLVAAEVTLSNSTVIQVDESHHSDLLWALRGGGPNYGIVTSFTYQTQPIDKVWFAAKVYKADQNQQLINALFEYQQRGSKDPKANIVLSLSQDNSTARSFVGFLYLDPAEPPSVFSPFYDIPSAVDMINSTVGTLSDLSAKFYEPQYPEPGTVPLRHYVVSLPHKVDNMTYQDSFKAFTSHAAVAMASGWSMGFGAQPILTAAVKASKNTPLNLVPVDQDWVHITLQWESPEDDDQAIRLIVSMGESIAKSSIRHKSQIPYRFMNDAYDGQRVLSSYGTNNFRKLSSISTLYDPDRVFQNLQQGGWLLSRES